MRGRGLGKRASEEKNEGAKSPGPKIPSSVTAPLALRAFVSGVRSSPLPAKSRQPRLFPPSVPQCGAAAIDWHRGRAAPEKGGLRPARVAEAASAPCRPARARVFCPRAGWAQPNRKRARGGPSGKLRGAGASSAAATGARAEGARRASLTDRPETGPTQSG